MNTNVTPEMTIDLLEEAGVNEAVINYLRQNPTLLHEKAKTIIGTDFAPEISHFKSQYVEKIKQGSDNFKILDNGDIWLSNFSVLGNKPINHGLFRDPANAKYKNKTENITLSSHEGHIVKRTITHKGFVQNGQYYYDSSLLEENFDENNILIDGLEAKWENNPNMNLPSSVYGFSFKNNPFTNTRETQMDGHDIKTDTPEWHLTAFGKMPELKEQTIETNEKKNSIIGRFKLVKSKAQQLFSPNSQKTPKSFEEEMKEFIDAEKQLQGLSISPNQSQAQAMSTEEIFLQAQKNDYATSNYKPRYR